MRLINKGTEPPSLATHRATPHSDYLNLSLIAKKQLRKALVDEQRALCCYCMGRIEPSRERMKIEHWKCQEDNKDLQLRYSNLLGACKGGEGQQKRKQHCDTRKGKLDLAWNPAVVPIETKIRYELNGTIRSGDKIFDAQLCDVLNLNLVVLRNRRKAALTGVIQWWNLEKSRRKGRPSNKRIRQKIRSLEPPQGTLREYSPVAVWWLTKKLAR